MLRHPDFDPVAIQLGPLSVHWYGLMYMVAFGLAWWLGRVRASDPARGWRKSDVDDVIFYAALGIVAGGRIGYMLFYDLPGALREPLSVLRVWEGGMSFHGGLIGVIVAMRLYARRRGRAFFDVTDFIAPLVPLGIAVGRVGNFINGNLWGSPSTLPWAMVFPGADDLPRHPSQLYQATLEGVGLFALLWWFSRRPRPAMATSGLFLLAYAVVRSAVEFVRVPDRKYGYLAFDWLTMGQVLCVPMALGGAWLLWRAHVRSRGARAAPDAK